MQSKGNIISGGTGLARLSNNTHICIKTAAQLALTKSVPSAQSVMESMAGCRIQMGSDQW